MSLLQTAILAAAIALAVAHLITTPRPEAVPAG
jgi:hypothetical protein